MLEQLIALYHKVHLFEGDIPSDKITLKVRHLNFS